MGVAFGHVEANSASFSIVKIRPLVIYRQKFMCLIQTKLVRIKKPDIIDFVTYHTFDTCLSGGRGLA